MVKKINLTVTVTLAVIVCLVLCIGGMFLSHWYAEKYFEVPCGENPQALLGDSFGAVNALISAFAFAGVIVAIFIERNELRLQRKDLFVQQQEFAIQNETLQLQRFENTFFNMLTLQQRIVFDLCYKDEKAGKIVQGRELFFFSFEEMPHWEKSKNEQKEMIIGMREYLAINGLSCYDDCHTPSYFDHYFRHLYTIIKFIDNSDLLSFEEKYKYTSMVRATLSRYELVWLFYNGLSIVGNPKFKKFIERYSLLKNIREDLLTLCKENNDIFPDKNINRNKLLYKGYSGTDYNFWVTADNADPTKYYVGAFYSKNDLPEGILAVNEMQNFIALEM
ncbi:putative phage abortive infection protein [Phocaeicola dorei]|uniref:putative phage abortive infection protein n=1 Tax=Phocaeicola dorei TaxID=357276 RepID=UPI0039B3B3BE